MARQASSYGFWRGALTGLIFAAVALLALALAYPPTPLRQPDIAPGSTTPPAALVPPGDVSNPPRSDTDTDTDTGLLPEPPSAPLIEGVPAPDSAPAPAGAAGSPSLVPSSKP